MNRREQHNRRTDRCPLHLFHRFSPRRQRSYFGAETPKIAALIALMSFAAACSSSSTASAPTTSAPTTTTTQPTATVRQVASIVAQYRGQISAATTKLASCQALQGVAPTDDPLNVLNAKLTCQSGVLETSTPSLLLARGLTNVRPPAEVAALAEATRAAARKISDLGTTYNNCLTAANTNDKILGCVINFQWDMAYSDLGAELAGWDAYL